MNELLLIGCSHKTAPIRVRERISLTTKSSADFLRELRSDDNVLEALALSTCNRLELYLVARNSQRAKGSAVGALARLAQTTTTQLTPALYCLHNCDVAQHLLHVTSGLDSMVIGEVEIQGQVKRSYELALQTDSSGPLLNKLLRVALSTGKRVRSTTNIASGALSVASLAVDLARKTLGSLDHTRLLIIGSGETAELTAQAFSRKGISMVFVANRRRERALELARRFDGETVALQQLPAELVRADVVVGASASPHSIVGRDELNLVMSERGGRPLLLIDLAVPRDIDPDCALIENVILHDIDSLNEVVNANARVRSAEVVRAQAIIDDELQAFATWLGMLEVGPTLTALRQSASQIADDVINENQLKLSRTSNDAEIMRLAVQTAINRLLHKPTTYLKQLEGERRHAALEVLRELFDLDSDEATSSAIADVHELSARPKRSAAAG